MLSILLLSDVATQFVAAELKGEFEVHEAPGYGQYAHELLDGGRARSPSAPLARVLILEGEPTIAIPSDVIVIRAPKGAEYRDARMAKLAGCPWSLKGIKAIAQAVRDALAPKKVLALDYDGTLWHGIFSEEGAQCTVRGDVQERALDLKRAGMLLVGLSKNNPEDVASAWSLPGMRLKSDDFILAYVDWQEKADNIARAAQRLNLGLASFVFVDDRPIERERMRAAHPEVTVMSPEELVRGGGLPGGQSLPSPSRNGLAGADVLGGPHATDRTEQYRAQLARWDDYLGNLAIRTDIHPIKPAEYARVAELSQKSNQFNCTTRRFTVEDIARMAADPAVRILTLSTSDKYGDLGLVAFAIAQSTDGRARSPSAPRITDFVMSCRAMNRGHEDQLFAAMTEALGARPVLDFRETPKNAPAKEFVCRMQHS